MADTYPAEVSTFKVVGRFVRGVADSNDVGQAPDLLPISNVKVTFTPSLAPPIFKVASATPPVTIYQESIVAVSDNNGYLKLQADTELGVVLVNGFDPDIEPNGWTWDVKIEVGGNFPDRIFTIQGGNGLEIDLATVVPVPASPGEDLLPWVQAVNTVTLLRDEVNATVDQVYLELAGIDTLVTSLVATAIADDETITAAAVLAVGDVIDETDIVRGSVDSSNTYDTTTTDPATGGFVDENGRETDLVVRDDGTVPDRVIDRWASRLVEPLAAEGMTQDDSFRSHFYGGGFADETGRMTDLAVDLNGNIMEESLDNWAPRLIPKLIEGGMAEDASSSVLSQVYAGPDFNFIGDSLTAQGGLSGEMGRQVPTSVSRNMGVGGEGVGTIMGRLGAWPMMVLIPAGAIPATGSTVVTLTSSYPSVNVAPLMQGTGVREGDGMMWGTILDVRVRLTLSGSTYSITRDVDGAAVPVVRAEPFIPEYGVARQNDITIAYIGQNGPSDAVTEAAFNGIEQWLKHRGGDKFIFISKPTGSSLGWTTHESVLYARWGRRYVNIRRFLAFEAMDLMGLTKTSEDLADIAAGRVPRSLRKTNTDGSEDTVHQLVIADYATVQFLLLPRMKELGYF